MTFDLRTIFLPSVGVDIVFNINSLAPYSRSSIIYDTDHINQTIIIAQPLTPLSKNTQFKEFHLSTVVNEKQGKIRVGIACEKFDLIKQYELANKKTVPAVKIKYTLPAKEINIRSAYRLPLSAKYIIKGKLLFQGQEYYTSRDFSIRDISLSGAGLTIPKKRNAARNPLLDIKLNDKIRLGFILIQTDLDEPIGTLPLIAQVTRINQKYSETHYLFGLKTIKIKPEDDNLLNKFIHDAQVDELKRLSRRNL